MDAHTVMEDWEASPFDGGFDGLQELRSRRFSGAVEAGSAWLFFRDGEPLAVLEDLEVQPRPGDVDAFEDATGRTHEASNPATATLAAMLALDGEVRGQYFTDDTPLSTVHETLSDGGFTGYVELSENVLSGDYYVVYEDGDEAYLGVLGSSNRLITGEEAQSKAEGEVGIYSVVAVRFPDVDLPETGAAAAAGTAGPSSVDNDEDTESDPSADVGDGSAGVADAPADTSPADELGADELEDPGTTTESSETAESVGSDGSGSGGEPAVEAPSDAVPADSTGESEPDPAPESSPDSTADRQDDPASEPGSVTDAGSETHPGTDDTGRAAAESETEREPESTPDVEAEPTSETEAEPGPEPEPEGGSTSDATDRAATGGSTDETVMESVTTRTVPSLDPERTGRAESSEPSGSGGGAVSPSPDADSSTEPEETPGTRTGSEPQSGASPESEPDGRSASEPGSEPDTGDRIEAVREEYEDRVETLQAELDALRDERDRLRERVESLQADGSAGGSTAGPGLSSSEAMAGTSLFVREGTRGEATLEDAHAGRTDRETLHQNLRIEYHTQFDDAEATVDGQPFDAWLRSTVTYEFVEWLVVDLLFEIQSTGSEGAMRHLYDALPEIDRIGFDDAVTVGDGQEGREIEFDVVARNRMGDPLVVANIDEGREPTRADTMQPLISEAGDVCEEHESLACTVAVTSSYFEPDALDAAREATSGSLLGREKYRSYVKLSRSNGFHLCLVESREETFHLASPEL